MEILRHDGVYDTLRGYDERLQAMFAKHLNAVGALHRIVGKQDPETADQKIGKGNLE